jgi:glutamate synthase (NADPH/NADH) small chain
MRMSAAPLNFVNSKYAWLMIDRATPPKRSAAERIKDFREIYLGYGDTAVIEQASRCIQCPDPNCVRGCPLSNRIPEWLALASEGDFIGASEISRSTSNMPEICSRVCPQERLCEGSCILNGRSEPVAIGAIERFINEYAISRGAESIATEPPNGFRIGVVGSGPGGIACADELIKRGYLVTVFESQPQPGGLLANGIPSFKLDKAVVARRVELLRRRGVAFRLGVRVGWDISLEELRAEFDAVFLATGAQESKPFDIPGWDLNGVVQALPFLTGATSQSQLQGPWAAVEGKRVAVLGGGDTAMDCLRSAIRCGAMEAACLYRRDLANMPGSRKEYANALEEGATFHFLVNPVYLEGTASGEVIRVRCVRMELGQPEAGGRRTPHPIAGSEFTVPADIVLVAYGFDPAPYPEESDFRQLRVNDWGGLVVDADQMTSLAGVFAGGDSTRGPSLVVNAVRDGRRAAAGIRKYLNGLAAQTLNA